MSEVDHYILRGHDSQVNVCRFLYHGNHVDLLSGDESGKLYHWSLKQQRAMKSLRLHNKGILNVWQLNHDRVLTQGRDGFLKTFSLNSATADISSCDEIVTGSLGFCKCCIDELHGNSKFVACPSLEADEICIWDIKNKTVCSKFSPKTICSGESNIGMAMDLELFYDTSDNLYLACLFENGNVYIYDAFQGKKLELSMPLYSKDVALSFDFHQKKANKFRGIIGGAGNTLVPFRFDLEKHTFDVISDAVIELKTSGISHVKIRDDSKIAYTCGWDNKVRAYNLATLQPLAILSNHKSSVYFADCCKVDCTSKYNLATCSKDKNICLYSIY